MRPGEEHLTLNLTPPDERLAERATRIAEAIELLKRALEHYEEYNLHGMELYAERAIQELTE